jgi:hypothetical protein
MIKRLLLISAAAWIAVPTTAIAHVVAQTHFLETAKPYAPYEFLIGDWYSKLARQDMVIHQQFRWGPGKSYIAYATYLAAQGKPEELHFEGMMVWNGKSRGLDFLFAVQPGSGAEERGTVNAKADGSVVRDVEMTGDDGDLSHFRQTFRKSSDGTIVTSIMQKTSKGWASSPPGEIVMEKRPSSDGTAMR